MAELSVSKKLRQTTLTFGKLDGKLLNENKENIHLKSKRNLQKFSKCNLPILETSATEPEINFKSIPRKSSQTPESKRSNTIEIRADVHPNIQCPEISTSSIHSDSEEENSVSTKSPEVIDLTECSETVENAAVGAKTKKHGTMSEDAKQNIDDAITAVIRRSLDDREALMESCAAFRESKKRKRSKSPRNLPASDEIHTTSEVATNDLEGSADDEASKITFSSTLLGEAKIKKPRRSISDMFQAAKLMKSVSGASSLQATGDLKPAEARSVSASKASTETAQASTSEGPVTKVVDVEMEDCEEQDCEKMDSSPEQSDADDREALDVPDSTRSTEQSLQERASPAPSESASPAKDRPSDADVECTEAEQTEDRKSSSFDERDLQIIAVKSPNSTTTTQGVTKPKPGRRSNPEVQLRKEHKEKEKEEKRRAREEAKQVKELEKAEIKKKKEEERAVRDEEKRKKKEEIDRAKEEKLKKKQEEQDKKKAELEAKRLEREQKEEERQREKQKKDNERRLKEEEKQKIIEEKQRAEEELKRIKNKQVSSFKNFFHPSPARTTTEKKVLRKSFGNFVQFHVKEDMVLAPSHRRVLPSVAFSELDRALQEGDNDATYLTDMKSARFRPRKGASTLPKKKSKLLSLSEDGLELVIGNDKGLTAKEVVRAKLLQFTDNNRPPYYGTWRKTTAKLTSRNPFKKDEDLFDYEVDSDDEWEDPGEGEDIANSDGEEDNDKDDDEDECDGFFVPHGYLSDDEGLDADGEVNEDLSEQKLKMKQQEFENSFKQKLKVLTPVNIGCVWPDVIDNFSKHHVMTLRNYEMTFFVPEPVDLDALAARASDKLTETTKVKRQPGKVPEEAIPDLIRMLHGNPLSAQKLIKEFQLYWELKNARKLRPNQGPLPLDDAQDSETGTAMETEPGAADREVSELLSTSNMDVTPSPSISPCASKPCSPDPAKNKISDGALASGIAGVTVTTPVDKSPHWIPKSQILKKIKEIGVYGRKDDLSRSCWFVIDSMFETYQLNRDKFPIPCRWGYVTSVPDLKIFQVNTSTTLQQATNTAVEPAKETSTTSARHSIDKFTAKVSAETLLEESRHKEKLEKERQASLVAAASAAAAALSAEPVANISKYTTSKVSAEELIEMSSQKLAQQTTSRRVELTTISSADAQPWLNESTDSNPLSTATFGVPTHAAFKSFFKMEQPKTSVADPNVTSSGDSKTANVTAAADEKRDEKSCEAPMEL